MAKQEELKIRQERQIKLALEAAIQALRSSDPEDSSGGDARLVANAFAAARAVIWGIAGENSSYARQLDAVFTVSGYVNSRPLPSVVGILEALRQGVANGFLQSTSELIHGSLFADYLEMAQHLIDEGFKDPAAVLAGSTLESHLRQLCLKGGVATDTPTASGSRPKKADQLNTDLVKQTVYSGLDQKNVTAWLDLRNKAAHGKYSEYTADQVALLIQGVRDFITRNPA